MEDKICLESDFLVNFLRNKQWEAEYIKQHEESVVLATTIINLFELYYGAYKSGVEQNILKLEELQRRLRILNLSEEAARKAGQLLAQLEKNGKLIEFRDLLIGCIAQTEGYCLKTYKEKHFQRIPELKLV